MRGAVTALVLLLCGCQSLPPPPPIIGVPADPEATGSAKAVLAYLAALSDDTLDGVVAGQNIGHGFDFDAPGPLVGYPTVIGGLERLSGEVPGLVGVDYEYVTEATAARLSEVNRYLVGYWKAGGLVTINWSPHFPLWSAIARDRTRTASGPLNGFRLTDLIDPAEPVHAMWMKKLDVVAGALAELRDAGVAVLWRPLQGMNGDWFWWGNKTASPAEYQAVWRHMFRYFTETKGLHNLLLVLSPNPNPRNSWEFSHVAPLSRYYPGGEFVDVIAGTRYSDTLDIPDYREYQQWGKPLGVGEYGPVAGAPASRSGSFDTLLYRDRLIGGYPKMAYWVSWHGWNDGAAQEHQALVSNKNAAVLLADPLVLTRSRLRWGEFAD